MLLMQNWQKLIAKAIEDSCANGSDMIQLNPQYEAIFSPRNIVDDMYSPEYSLQWIYEDIMKYDIDQESRKLLEDGHKEIQQSECYQEYGYPSYINR